MNRALLCLALLASCKNEQRSVPSAGSGTGSAAPVLAPPPIDPRVASLPGELWFVEDEPSRLVRLAGGTRVEVEPRLFTSNARLPDGRLVAISSRGDGSPISEQLVLVAADGTKTPFGPQASQVRDPVAIDTTIIAAIQNDGRSELYRIDDAGLKQLTDNKQGNFHPARLGTDAIAFVSSRDGDSELYRMPVAGGVQQRLTAFHKDDWAPTPSPDGATIAFLSDREGPPRICVIAADGTRFRRLTTRAGRDLEEAQPQWSPDGTQIAYVIRGDGRGQLVVQTLASGAETIMTPANASDAEPVWAPDSAWIAVVRAVGRESQLIAVPVGGGGGEPVRISGGSAELPRWFPATR